MPDEKLTPATRSDVEICLALALTSGRALARSQAAETMSKTVAERLVAELEAAGFVVMRKPIPNHGAGDNAGQRGFKGYSAAGNKINGSSAQLFCRSNHFLCRLIHSWILFQHCYIQY
jgi:hypothetical protein